MDLDKNTTTSADETTKFTGICSLCLQQFSDKDELKDHYKSVHKDCIIQTSVHKTKEKRLERKFNRYLCKLCGKHFADLWTLSHHQKTVHNSVREHQCNKCDKAFLSNKDKVRHYRGVHLGEKITFPGSRKPITQKTSIQTKTIPKEKTSNKLPNILKSSKIDKKSTQNLPDRFISTNPDKSVVKVIGLEKTGPVDIRKEVQESETNVIVEIDEAEVDLEEDKTPGEQPMFQLENLENLQLVLPENSAEPQIIIPETGIRLTIQADNNTDGQPLQQKILHLIPEASLSADSNNLELEHQVGYQCLGPVSSSEEFPKHFIYKKENSANGSSKLVSVKENEKSVISPEYVQQLICEKCNKCFISKDFLNKHMQTSHSELPSFNINLLDSIQTLDNLSDIDIEGLNPEDIVESSMKVGCNVEDLLSKNSGLKPYFNCKICGSIFDNKAAQQKHRNSFHKKPQVHKCEDCGSEFTSSQTLKAHVQSIHEGIKKVCSICLKPVVDLTRHVRTQHKNGDKRDFPCNVCNAQFRTKFSLQRHKETVHLKVKAWACDLCEKSFGEKRDMERHKKAVHFGIKNKNNLWNCPECNITFKLRKEYDSHKSSYHAQLSEEEIVRFLNYEMEIKEKQKYQVNDYKLV